MNPMPNPNQKVTTSTFDEIMEEAFMPAAGTRRTCGARPLRLQLRYMGKGGLTRYNTDYENYQKCIESVRQMNLSQGMPADTGLSPDSTGAPDSTGKSGNIPPVDYSTPPSEPTGMSTGAKIGIAVGIVGVLAIGFWAITKATKPKMDHIPLRVGA